MTTVAPPDLPRGEKSRARRVFGRVAAGLGLGVTFVGAAVFGVVLHLDSPVARRIVVREVNAVLAQTFDGTITIDRLDSLGVHDLSGLHARIADADGALVLRADGVSARYSLVDIGRSLLLGGKGDIEIVLTQVAVDDAYFNLDTDATGKLRFERAMQPRAPRTMTPPGAAPARKLRFAIPFVEVRRAKVQGTVNDAPPLDFSGEELRAAVLVNPSGVDIMLMHLSVTTHGMPGDADGEADVSGHLALPSKTGKNLGAEVTLHGTVFGIPITTDASIDGVRLDATVTLPEFAADELRAWFPAAPIYGRVAAAVELHGELPELEVKAHFGLGSGTADVSGNVRLTGDVRADVRLDAKAIDLRTFLPKAPASTLGAVASVALQKKPGGLAGTFTVDVVPGTIGAEVVPGAAIRGELAKGPDGVAIHARATIAELGAPSEVSFDLTPEGASWVIDMTAKTNVPRLEAIPRVGPIARGRAALQAKARYRLADKVVDATLDAEVHDAAVAGQRVQHAHLSAHLAGPIVDPMLSTRLDFSGASAVGFELSHGRISTQGHVMTPHVEASISAPGATRVEARADVAIGGETSVRAAHLSLARGDATMTARAELVRIAPGDVRVDGVMIEGIGEPARASVRVHGSTLAVRAQSNGLDLARLGYLLRLEKDQLAGRLAFNLDFTLDHGQPDGRLVADVTGGALSKLTGVVAHVDLNASGRRFSVNAHASAGEIGVADLRTSVMEIGGAGPLFSTASWKKVSGTARLVLEVDLAKAASRLPASALPIDDIRGVLVGEVRAGRDSESDVTPELVIRAKTKGLVVALKAPPRAEGAAAGKPPWRSSGIDVEMDAKINGVTGAAELATRLVDKSGVLLAVDAKSSSIPWSAVLAPSADTVAELERTRFTAKVSLPRRNLDKVPYGLVPAGTSGEIEATLDVDGTVREPKADLVLQGHDLKSTLSPVDAALGAAIVAHYDGKQGDARVRLRTPRAVIVDGTVHVDAKVADALGPERAEFPWKASTRLRVTSFPLRSVAALSDRQIRGRLSGELALDDLHENARGAARFRIEDLQIGSAKFMNTDASFVLGERSLQGMARLEQGDGFLETKGKIGLAWGKSLTPSIDHAQRVEASLRAMHFRASALLPFLENKLNDLDGRIDADLHVDVATDGSAPKMGGTLSLTEGAFQLSSFGQDFHNAQARVVLTPEGEIRLQDLVAYGVAGKLMASGVAHLNGFDFVDARAKLTIPKGQPILLDMQGSQIGTLYGDFDLCARAGQGIATRKDCLGAVKSDVSPDQKVMNLFVDIPVMHVDMPASAHGVQALDEPEHVHVGVYRAGKFVPVAIDGEDLLPEKVSSATTLNVTVHLGDDVQVKRGSTLKVVLIGDPVIKIADQTRVSGQIRLISGSLEVQGKRFDIERGTVTFVGSDPTNPQVVVTAGWIAGDGTHVYADFVGPLKTGRVTLRSEPARPKNEILALILFGTVDGSSATPYASPQASGATGAGTTAGGFATEGLTQGLDKLTGLEIKTKIDTTQSANPRPEVELQIARDISLQIAFVLGTPPPGTNPDKTFVTVAWRFLRNWSLETTFGDQGSSFADVIWQYRY